MPTKTETGEADVDDTFEVLKSNAEQNVLPYLTLKNLSESEQSKVIQFWDKAINRDQYKMPPIIWMNRARDNATYHSFSNSEKFADALKLFNGLVIDYLNTTKISQDKKDAYAITCFASNNPRPNDLSSLLELLSIAERSENYYPKRFLYDGVFDTIQDDDSILLDTFKKADAIQCMKMIPILSIMHSLRTVYSKRAENARKELPSSLRDFLFHLARGNKEREKRIDDDHINELINSLFELEDDGSTIIERRVNDVIQYLKNDKNTTPLVKLAAECIGGGSQIDVEHKTVEYYDKDTDIDYSMSYLLNMVHESPIKSLVEDKLVLKLDDISLGAQVQLLKFMTEAKNGRFNKLCNTLSGVSEDLRLKLAESFLAADFGEDFGDALLNIAGSERLNDGEKEKILDTISSCRESIGKIAGLYSEFDGGQFTKEYARSANERLTDAVTVFERIAKDGSAEVDLGWPGKMKYDYKSALEALQYEAKTLAIISGVMEDVGEHKDGAFAEIVLHPDRNYARENRTLYNFYSPEHGYVLLYTRPEGSHSFDPMMEYGKIRSRYDKTSPNAGVEASVSFIANPVEPFSLPKPYKPDPRVMRNQNSYDHSTMDKVSGMRLDREGRAPGMEADDPNRDPVNPVGMVSVDLAAIGDRADTPSGKIARLFATGNALRAVKSGADSALNHNTKWFEQEKYGTEKGFSKLVGYVDGKMSDLTKNCPPKAGEGYTAIMRQIKRSRGGKAVVANGQMIA